MPRLLNVFGFLLIAAPLIAQPRPFIAPPDSFMRARDTVPFTYERQLQKTLNLHTPWVELAYYDLDTGTQSLALNTRFEVPAKLSRKLAKGFLSDTSLTSVEAPIAKGEPGMQFQFGKTRLKWSPLMHAFISEDSLPLLAIGKHEINRKVHGRIMIEHKRSGNVLTIYLEHAKAWYTFVYANGVMLVYSSDEADRTIMKRHPESRGKQDQPKYKCFLGSPNERSLLLKKVKRAEAFEIAERRRLEWLKENEK